MPIQLWCRSERFYLDLTYFTDDEDDDNQMESMESVQSDMLRQMRSLRSGVAALMDSLVNINKMQDGSQRILDRVAQDFDTIYKEDDDNWYQKFGTSNFQLVNQTILVLA